MRAILTIFATNNLFQPSAVASLKQMSIQYSMYRMGDTELLLYPLCYPLGRTYTIARYSKAFEGVRDTVVVVALAAREQTYYIDPAAISLTRKMYGVCDIPRVVIYKLSSNWILPPARLDFLFSPCAFYYYGIAGNQIKT